MENNKIPFERKTNLPLLHIKIPFGANESTRYLSSYSIQSVINLCQKIKTLFEGRFETVITPSDFEIKMERSEMVILNINNDTDIESILNKLNELGGNVNDQSRNESSVDER